MRMIPGQLAYCRVCGYTRAVALVQTVNRVYPRMYWVCSQNHHPGLCYSKSDYNIRLRES